MKGWRPPARTAGRALFDAMGVNHRFAPFRRRLLLQDLHVAGRVLGEALRAAHPQGGGARRRCPAVDPDTYDRGHIFCDLLVIGAGPAGLGAALTAARCRTRVALADEDFLVRRQPALAEPGLVGTGKPAPPGHNSAIAELADPAQCALMSPDDRVGVYDQGTNSAVERVTDHLPAPPGQPRQLLWRIYSRGASCAPAPSSVAPRFQTMTVPASCWPRPLDLCQPVAAKPGSRVAVFTNYDYGLGTADHVAAKGVDVVAIDPRARVCGRVRHPACAIPVRRWWRDRVRRPHLIRVRRPTAPPARSGATCWPCPAVGTSNVHPTAHQRGPPRRDEAIAVFVLGRRAPTGLHRRRRRCGPDDEREATLAGSRVAGRAVKRLRFRPIANGIPQVETEQRPTTRCSGTPSGRGRGTGLVDHQHDVTVKDVALAPREGFRPIEHLKRYTTLGMATDQGKTSNIGGIAVTAALTGQSVADTGTMLYRPPYVPIAIGAYAGRPRGREFRPVRQTPAHEWAKQQGRFTSIPGCGNGRSGFRGLPTGGKRSTGRMAARNSVGVCDVSTLGKIDMLGSDAEELLDRVYVNGFAKLAVGRRDTA